MLSFAENLIDVFVNTFLDDPLQDEKMILPNYDGAPTCLQPVTHSRRDSRIVEMPTPEFYFSLGRDPQPEYLPSLRAAD